MDFNEKLDSYISELLHIEETSTNKMIDLFASRGGETIIISDPIGEGFARRMVNVIKEHYGKIGNTVLRNSSSSNIILGEGKNIVDWKFATEGTVKELNRLNTFIKNANTELALKGANPLFLSVGAIKWSIPDDDGSSMTIYSPLLVFPIRFTRTSTTQPVNIEFVDDDVRLNECFLKKLESLFGPKVAADFPLPPPAEAGMPLDLEKLDVETYYNLIRSFINRSVPNNDDVDTTFELLGDFVAISTFRSGDIAMYYDILRNRDRINNSDIIKRLLTRQPVVKNEIKLRPELTLPADSVQEDLITRAVNGDSLVIKGPPGTGKTLTIANLIASLMGAGKRVMLVSEKNSALAEVCNKMPEQLRPYILKLFCESEADAAALDVNKLVRALKDALDDKSTENEAVLSQNRTDAQRRRDAADKEISKYIRLVYKEAGSTSYPYYMLLNEALKHEGTTPVENTFTTGETITFTYPEFLVLCEVVKKVQKYLLTITDNGAHSSDFCPWLNASEEVSPTTIASEIDELLEVLEPLTATLEDIYAGMGLDPKVFNLSMILPLTYALPDEEAIVKLFENPDNLTREFAFLKSAVEAAYLGIGDYDLAKKKKIVRRDGAKDQFDGVEEPYRNIYVGELYRTQEIISKIGEKDSIALSDFFTACRNTVLGIEALEKRIEDLLPVLEPQKPILAELLEKYAECLAELDGTDGNKLPMFALKAKGGLKKFYELGVNKLSFENITAASKSYMEKLALIAERDEQDKKIASLYGDKFTRDDFILAGKCLSLRGNCDPTRYIMGLSKNALIVKNLVSTVCNEDGTDIFEDVITVSELISVYKGAKLRTGVENVMKAICDKVGIYLEVGNLSIANAINTLVSLEYEGIKFTPEIVASIRRFTKEASGLYSALIELSEFASRNGLNPRFTDYLLLTPYALRRFCEDIRDLTLRNACIEIKHCLADDKDGIVHRFISVFISGEYPLSESSDLAKIFEHTYFIAASRDFEMLFEQNLKVRFDRDKLTILRNQFTEAEKDLANAQAELIRMRLRVENTEDQKFAFLKADRAKVRSARRFFAEYADAINAIAKCIVLSPYSVSVFMRPQQYNDFDVLIIDEASQLNPQTVLPAAFRAKQILLVGDEWQMPPIRHFVKKKDGGSVEDFERAESALDLALSNFSFDITGLKCHYRSQNETLIAFSQKRYYPEMTTFPTVAPFVKNMGLRDIYIPDGASISAKNEKEAEAVLGLIREHFDRYYDDKLGTLADSMGIVVFGQQQLKLVQSKIDADKDLTAKLNLALSNFNDVPEKLFFLTTVEQVQGQEISHLVISLTYGRTEGGGHSNAFGTLNRNGLGERMFNVAVTRSCKSLTLIHSVLASEIDSASIEYIKDYLNTVSMLDCSAGVTSFVSDSSKVNNFIRSVKRTLVDLGIPESRIVEGYGVTERSLRIPLAILSPDGTVAQIGIFCETPPEQGTYHDLAIRYPATLEARGWTLHRIFIHDWFFNRDREVRLLEEALRKKVIF